MPHIFHVLLTGGVGSRLWPLSRQSRPKQYLNLFSGSSPLIIEEKTEFTSSVLSVGAADDKTYREVTSSLPAAVGVFSDGRAEEKMYLEDREVGESDASLFELAVQRNTAFSNGLIVVGNQKK